MRIILLIIFLYPTPISLVKKKKLIETRQTIEINKKRRRREKKTKKNEHSLPTKTLLLQKRRRLRFGLFS